MSAMNNKDLLRRYTDETVTEDERMEFYRRFQAGEFDDLIEDDVRETIFAELAALSTSRQQQLDRIKTKILSDIDTKIVPLQKHERSRWLAAASLIAIALVAVLWMYSKGVFSPDILISQNETTAP